MTLQQHDRVDHRVIGEAIELTNKERTYPTEDQEHATLMAWARLQRFGDGKVADYLHHSPNGGLRSKREAAKFKAMGTLAGFPDLFCFVSKGQFNGLFIELKAHKGKVSDAQKEVIKRLQKQGYDCHVCFGFEAAKRAICWYLGVGV